MVTPEGFEGVKYGRDIVPLTIVDRVNVEPPRVERVLVIVMTGRVVMTTALVLVTEDTVVRIGGTPGVTAEVPGGMTGVSADGVRVRTAVLVMTIVSNPVSGCSEETDG